MFECGFEYILSWCKCAVHFVPYLGNDWHAKGCCIVKQYVFLTEIWDLAILGYNIMASVPVRVQIEVTFELKIQCGFLIDDYKVSTENVFWLKNCDDGCTVVIARAQEHKMETSIILAALLCLCIVECTVVPHIFRYNSKTHILTILG